MLLLGDIQVILLKLRETKDKIILAVGDNIGKEVLLLMPSYA